jgi:hypothetical protein
MDDPCPCRECTDRREHVARIKAMKAEWPKPEFDWADLEAADRAVRDRERQGKAYPENPPGSHPSHWRQK